jgi:hypothetical protein
MCAAATPAAKETAVNRSAVILSGSCNEVHGLVFLTPDDCHPLTVTTRIFKEPQFDKAMTGALEKHFRKVRTLLIILIVIAGSAAVLCMHFLSASWPVLICISTGLLGSSTTALISALNRRANGFEDSDGNQHPEPAQSKERFSEGMGYWLGARPVLGPVTGSLMYWGAVAGFFGSNLSKSSPEGLAFLGLLAGLFAKTLLDIMKNAMKGIFGLNS